jgi:SHS2 domain-containing protein
VLSADRSRGYHAGMYETFDHTADLGFRATAPDLDALFADMARCLFASVVENPGAIRPESEQTVELAGTDREFLLFDWLKELLYRFDAGHWLFAEFRVSVRDDGLTATIRGEPLDPARHLLSHEVKAITYHELKVEQAADGWLAEVIVDI